MPIPGTRILMRRAYPSGALAARRSARALIFLSATLRFAERVLPAGSLAVTVSLAVSFLRRASARRVALSAAFGSLSSSVALAPAASCFDAFLSRKTLAAPGTETVPFATTVEASFTSTATRTARRPSAFWRACPLELQ